MLKSNFTAPVSLILLMLTLDQALKIYIKTNFYLGEQVSVIGNWFYLHFTENNGMAFGMQLAGKSGKLFLSIFRTIAIAGLGYYLFKQIKKKADNVLIYTLSLVFAGAAGNLIDSCFYGLLFSESNHTIATILPAEGGYAPFMFGRVVDMFYFPLVSGQYPEWIPWLGGEYFEFFQPVFNLADACISVGVAVMLIFQKRVFAEH